MTEKKYFQFGLRECLEHGKARSPQNYELPNYFCVISNWIFHRFQTRFVKELWEFSIFELRIFAKTFSFMRFFLKVLSMKGDCFVQK